MQRAESKESHQQKSPTTALHTFFSNYSSYILNSQNINLDLQKLVESHNQHMNQFPFPIHFPVTKQTLMLSKEDFKELGNKLKILGEDKLVQTINNAEKLNSRLNIEYAMELNYAAELGLLEKCKSTDNE